MSPRAGRWARLSAAGLLVAGITVQAVALAAPVPTDPLPDLEPGGRFSIAVLYFLPWLALAAVVAVVALRTVVPRRWRARGRAVTWTAVAAVAMAAWWWLGAVTGGFGADRSDVAAVALVTLCLAVAALVAAVLSERAAAPARPAHPPTPPGRRSAA